MDCKLIEIFLEGIGHMVGAGIYVLTGTVAKSMAGPAIVLSVKTRANQNKQIISVNQSINFCCIVDDNIRYR